MSTRLGLGVVIAALTLSAAACGGGTTTPPESEPAAAPATDASGASRVFFVEPKDGATVKPETTVQFGSELITIAAVPAGDVKEVRPGTVHYHIATDAACLPAGEVIPKADPWVHFGNGSDAADIQLTPGTHTLTVQAGDDQHRTTEGLCETITVNVAP